MRHKLPCLARPRCCRRARLSLLQTPDSRERPLVDVRTAGPTINGGHPPEKHVPDTLLDEAPGSTLSAPSDILHVLEAEQSGRA